MRVPRIPLSEVENLKIWF